MGQSDDRSKRKRGTSTDIVHTGRDPFAHHGFVNPPVYRGSTVLFKSLESFEKREQRYTYGRRGTPPTEALENAICALEGGARTCWRQSALAAITTALLSFTKAGDHILVADTVYGPTRKIVRWPFSSASAIETTFYDPPIGGGIAELIRPNTRWCITESPGSQTFEMQDIPAIAAAAHGKGAWVMMDNTWATPLYFKPFEHGVDISIQAATKYIVGHADAMLGTITANERAAPRLIERGASIGICAGTEEVFLGLRGFRTLDVRLERHWRSGVEIARWLEQRPEVSRVLHPALGEPPGPRPLEAGFPRRLGPVLVRPEAGTEERRCGHARRAWSCSAWAHPGVASKAWCCPSMRHPTARQHNGSPKAQRCASTSA